MNKQTRKANSIKIQNLFKEFMTLSRKKVKALENIDLEIEPGCFFVLLGPSGCGKSTLLNIIAGTEKNDAGELWIGQDLVASKTKNIFFSPRQRDVAMVFQSYALYPHLTVFENIAFPLRIAKTQNDKIKSKVHIAAEILHISHLLDRKPAELSGGQRQRTALGRAIVREPKILLLDEPLSNLDALLRVRMQSELKKLQRELGITTVYVTHDQTEALSLGDKIAVLDQGQIIQTGTPSEIYNQPKNEFVARFVGSPPINILDSSLLVQIQKKYPAFSKVAPEKTTLGIRPSNLHLTQPDKGILKGKVVMVSCQGSDSLVYINVGVGQDIIVKVSGLVFFGENEFVGIGFDEEYLYVFD
ncbi:ABC transporter ATP-binding protein [Candidatus Margulisiibacteriota bacterium]